MSYFPMFVSLENKKCLVAGGGRVAKRKADTLISYGADVTVIAKELKNQFDCNVIIKEFEDSDITDDYFIVVAATDNKVVNKHIAHICHSKSINVNSVDSSESSSFIFGALGRIGDITIGVNSGNNDPVVSKNIRDSIMNNVIKIGTRKSKLAKIQAQIVADLIKKTDSSVICEIVELTTEGDKNINKSLSDFGGKGAFTNEFERAILDGTIDIAVHSAKDLPLELMKGLEILSTPKREANNDVFVTLKDKKLNSESIIGTGSIRRAAQLKYKHKDIRGNVDTRLKKLEAGEYDGVVLALAGLKRLGILNDNKYDFYVYRNSEFYPAPCQGIIAVEGRADCKFRELLNKINDEETSIVFNTERKLLNILNMGCHTPFGVYTNVNDGIIELNAVYFDNNAKYISASGTDYEAVAKEAAYKINAIK